MKKKNKNILTYEIRELLKDKNIQNLVLDIFKVSKKKKDNLICLSTIDTCISDMNYRCHKYQDEIDLNKCFNLPQVVFINHLKKNNIIKATKTSHNNSDAMYSIIVINNKKYTTILNWVKHNKYIFSYGLFSLNTLTCVTFFKDKLTKSKFRPDSGIYNVFKKLMTDKNHYISFEKIAKYIDKNNSEKESTYKDQSSKLIKALREKLYLTDGLGGKLLPMYSGGYKLISSILPE